MAVSRKLWRQASACLFISALGTLTAANTAVAQTPAQSQTVPPATTADAQDESQDIVVIASDGSSTRISADALRDAARAFTRHRPTYAPQATLYFRVKGNFDGLSLYLQRQRRDRDGSRPVVDLPIDANGYFALPVETVLDGGNWVLRANHAHGSVALQALPLSPNSRFEDRRFGDLRLQCQVAVAFARLGMMRAIAQTMGPCVRRTVRMRLFSDRPMATATITGAAQTISISADGHLADVPTYDPTIGNEARYRISYR